MIEIGYLLGILLIGWCLLYPGTDFYVRFINPGTIRRVTPVQKRLYLTFDDGPDPDYTPQVLKILAEYKVPASFFLVGAKAEQHPQLVAAIIKAGHTVGLHTQNHRHAYLMAPYQSRSSIVRGKETLERLTGRPVHFFRPPWGALNWFQFGAVLHFRLQIVLWSANARDWKAQTGQTGILRLLRQKIDNGAIIVLHDSGGEAGAPHNTVRSLPALLQEYTAKGFRFMALHDREDVG